MIKLRSLLPGLVVSVLLSSATGRAESIGSADEASLRTLYERLLHGWNRGSGAAFAAVFDEHAELVGPGGFHIKGRQRIASFHQVLFDGTLKGSHLVGVVSNVRFLTGDVAIVYAVGGPLMTTVPAGSLRRQSIHTMVAVRRNGNWLLEAFQNTPI